MSTKQLFPAHLQKNRRWIDEYKATLYSEHEQNVWQILWKFFVREKCVVYMKIQPDLFDIEPSRMSRKHQHIGRLTELWRKVL